MTYYLLGAQAEHISAIKICTCFYFEGYVCELCGGPPRKKCAHCGSDFDLRRVKDPATPADAWICGWCSAHYRGGREATNAYEAAHARHYAEHGIKEAAS
jgi:hypothetical protein